MFNEQFFVFVFALTHYQFSNQAHSEKKYFTHADNELRTCNRTFELSGLGTLLLQLKQALPRFIAQLQLRLCLIKNPCDCCTSYVKLNPYNNHVTSCINALRFEFPLYNCISYHRFVMVSEVTHLPYSVSAINC
jgi:hypothetical protein